MRCGCRVGLELEVWSDLTCRVAMRVCSLLFLWLFFAGNLLSIRRVFIAVSYPSAFPLTVIPAYSSS